MILPSEYEANQRRLLRNLFDSAIAAVKIQGRLTPYLPAPPAGRTIVVGAGKAAAAMAAELDQIWQAPLFGAVVTRRGYSLPDYRGRIEVIEASHPVPDASSVAAGNRMRELLTELRPDDLVIALISGGASALLVGLPDGVTLADKQAATTRLLSSGAPISAINTVRKSISSIKGGGLARLAQPARVLTLAVSDIPGDDIASIGSGPTIFGLSKAEEAISILANYDIAVPHAIVDHLRHAAAVEAPRSQLIAASMDAHLVVRPADALEAAANTAAAAGYEPIVLGDDLEGEARILGAQHAALALSLLGEGRRACLISGGETSVTVRSRGRGGRNLEYLLGLLIALQGTSAISAIAADTDGIDGSEDNAGGFALPGSIGRAEALGLDPRNHLSRNDSYPFFSAAGDLLITGPTYTNVNDFRAILIDPITANASAVAPTSADRL